MHPLLQVSEKMSTLNKRFAALHGLSTTLNLAAFGGLIFHGLVRSSFEPGL